MLKKEVDVIVSIVTEQFKITNNKASPTKKKKSQKINKKQVVSLDVIAVYWKR